MAMPAGAQFIQVVTASGVHAGATCEYYDLSDVAQAVYSNAGLTSSLGATLNGGNASNSLGIFPIHFLDPSLSYKRIIKLSDGSTFRTDNPVQTAAVASDTVGIVTSIATLQATTFGATPPALISILYNSSAGDGGGFFRYDSSDTSTADNGATVIVDASGKRWKRQTLSQLFDIAVTNGWRLPSANTPTLYANSTAVASATSAGGVVGSDVTTPASARAMGFRGSPIVAFDANATVAASDFGKTFYHTTGATPALTIDSNANLALPIGFMFSVVSENGAGSATVAITTDTLRFAALTGTRTFAANSSGTFLKVAATVWRLTGSGIT